MKYIMPIVLMIVLFCSAGIIPEMQSIREAIEVRWLPPVDPFKMGEILHFNVVATNIAEDTAICYALSAGEIKGDSIIPYSVVELVDKYVYDTLAPGESSSYIFTLVDGSSWLFDPYKDRRDYGEPVGLPCFPPGEYNLTHMVLWGKRETISFEVIEQTDSIQLVLLDSLAEIAVAFFVDRPERSIKNAHFCWNLDPNSPLTARALILARSVAWNKGMNNDAIEMDSLFWVGFGGPEKRHFYLPNPGFFLETFAVLKQCSTPERSERYLDWLSGLYDDALREQIEKFRGSLIE
jgi:hypothetical protein